jgi:hypothetical protein
MISCFDFEDAIDNLFESHEAYNYRKLEEYSGLTIYTDLYFFAHKLVGSEIPHEVMPQIRYFHSQLDKFNIRMEIINRGIDNMDRSQMIDYSNSINLLRNRFFYFKMISSFLNNISEIDKPLFEENKKLRKIASTGSFGAFVYLLVYEKNTLMSFSQLGLKVKRSPQSSINQLFYLRQQNKNSEICCGPLGILIPGSSLFIKDIDFSSGVITEYDFGLLALRMKLPPSILRKCLFGSLLYFLCHPSTKNKIKYLDAYMDNQNEFEATYKKLKLQKQQILIDQISFLRDKFTHDKIDLTFVDEICDLYGFNCQEILDHCSYYFNNLVLTTKNEVISYPGNENFKNTRYIIDDVDPRLVNHFCQGEVNEEIIYLLSKINDHKYIIFYPKFDFVEFLYVYNVYYVKNAQEALQKYLKLYSDTKSQYEKFWFQYFKQNAIQLVFNNEESEIRIPVLENVVSVDFMSYLMNFLNVIRQKCEFKSIKNVSSSYCDISNYIYLSALHQLKYIDLTAKAVLVPAAAFIHTKPGTFSEEIIMIFEILRNNLLMDDIIVNGVSIYKSFELFMNNNIFDDALYTDTLTSFFLRKSKTSNARFFKGIGMNNMDFLAHSFDEIITDSVELTDLSHEQKENIRLSLAKSLTIVYRTIKQFQASYKKFYNLDKTSVKADLILSKAFENFALKSLIIGSRIFSFIKTNFVIPDLYAIDMTQFQQIIYAVQRSLKVIIDSLKVEFLFHNPLLNRPNRLGEDTSNLPFDKNYSVDGGKLFKIMSVHFLIYEALLEENDPYLKEFVKEISPDRLLQVYKIDFYIPDFLKEGKQLVDKLHVFLINIDKFSEAYTYAELREHLSLLSQQISRIISYYCVLS